MKVESRLGRLFRFRVFPAAVALAGLASSLFAGQSVATSTPLPLAGTLRVYVAGESIERRNRWVEPPFLDSGILNSRGGGNLRNDDDEYGWMVPMRDRLRLRAPDLNIEFVGSDVWANDNDNPYTGTYPSANPEPTSAISGTSIPSWLEQRRGELENRTFCYDLAFASRGGNDFGNDNDAEYKAQLKELVLLLAQGSSCRADPVVVVTGHMPDDQRSGETPAEYVALVLHRYVERAQQAVSELLVSNPGVRVRFADQYSPFLANASTTAFPSEVWSIGGIPDYDKICRTGDSYHPRRLASAYAGELAADSLDLQELRALVGGTCSVAITGPTSVCAGEIVTLDAGPGFVSYRWSTGATTRTITISPSTPATYFVSVTAADGCQASSPGHPVAVNPLPSAAIDSPVSMAPGATGNASVHDAGSGAAYSWTISGGTIQCCSDTRVITFTANASGVVVLFVSVTTGSNCASSGSTAILVTSTPCTGFSIDPTSAHPAAAAGSVSVAVTGASPEGCQGGSWSASGNGDWLAVGPISGTGSGSVTVSWTGNTGSASRSATITIAGRPFSVTQEGAENPPTNAHWIPVATHADGAASSRWRTDVAALNPTRSSAEARVRFHAPTGTAEVPVTIAAGAQSALGDIVQSLFATGGSAAVEIVSASKLLVTSRTYNQIASEANCFPGGSFGQDLAARAPGEGMSAGASAWFLPLSENPGFRTNLAVTNGGEGNAEVDIELFDASGLSVAAWTLTVAPGEWRPENRAFLIHAAREDVTGGAARMSVRSGSGIFAYASVIDALTNDPTTIPPAVAPASAGPSLWIPVATHADGANGSRWRTDVGLLVTGGSPASVELRLYVPAGVVTSSLVLPSKTPTLLVDLVFQKFGLSATGSLEIVSNQPIVASSRTYNLLAAAEACSPGGTLGQDLPALRAADALAAGETAWLLQLSENTWFRSNLAVVNAGNVAASVEISLFDLSGVELAGWSVELAPGEWKQENRVFAVRAGRSDISGGYAKVAVASGSGVIAYGSVVDARTNDPTTIPPLR